MSIYKLCPFCSNNSSCKSPVAISIVVGSKDAVDWHDSAGMAVSLYGGIVDNRTVCNDIEEALTMAIKREAEQLTFIISPRATPDEALTVGAVLNCRTILHLNHKAASFALKEIRLVCTEAQVENLKVGLGRSHPLCVNCFEKSCIELGDK